MKELSEYTDELHRRVELRVQTRRQRRLRTLAVCVPLVLCIVVGALAVPPMLTRLRGEAGPDLAAGEQDGLTDAVAGGAVDGDAPAGSPEGIDSRQEPEDGLSEQDGAEGPGEMPADFSFRFVWGCYGISSYDSRTGELVKTTDATHPEDYVTALTLTEAQRAEVWRLLSALELETYPASYDPYNDPASDQKVASEPNRNLLLTLRADGQETTVSCLGVCLEGVAGGYDERARTFLAACDKLTLLLTGTPEWKALPDYEFLYE
jgi:hypothetical protein